MHSFKGKKGKLASSNPDAVILYLPKSACSDSLPPDSQINNISTETQKNLDDLFKQYSKKVSKIGQIVSFISIKTSTRSDRRYQYIIEGNSVKGLYATAFNDDSKLKYAALMDHLYYAFTLQKKKPADHKALDGLIMFASLFNEAVGSARAVDALYDCPTPNDVAKKIKKIVKKHEEKLETGIF